MDMKDLQDKVNIDVPVRRAMEDFKSGIISVIGVTLTDNQVLLFMQLYYCFRGTQKLGHDESVKMSFQGCLIDAVDLDDTYNQMLGGGI